MTMWNISNINILTALVKVQKMALFNILPIHEDIKHQATECDV